MFYDTPKQLTNTIGLVKEQFFEEQYLWLDVKGKDVVDIGANIGDAAIYFALNGTKHISRKAKICPICCKQNGTNNPSLYRGRNK